MENTSLSERFLAAYNELDEHMRRTMGQDNNMSHSYMVRDMAHKSKFFAHFKEDLLWYADLRNVLVHNPYIKNADPIAEPHIKIVEKYEMIKDSVIHPPRALTVAVPVQDIYKTNFSADAIEVMNIMTEKGFSHVPVIEDEKLVGVFSENSILNYLVSNNGGISNNATIKDFTEFIPLGGHNSELFDFVERDMLLDDVQQMFEDSVKNHHRLGVVFVTENGKEDEKLLGLITAWDAIKHITNQQELKLEEDGKV